MKKQIGKNLMQKWKNKIRVRLSALDKKKLVLTNIPYILTAFYTNRASFLYRNSLGEDIGNKLLYAMEHADRILTGLQPSFNWRDMLTGIVAAVILKLLVWQKQSDAKKLRKGIEYGSARWGNAEDIKPYMSEDPWMNIPLTATETLDGYTLDQTKHEVTFAYADDSTPVVEVTFNLTNEKPEVPETPSTPDVPQSHEETKVSDAPKTGDNTNIWLPILLLLISTGGMAGLYISRKKIRKQ